MSESTPRRWSMRDLIAFYEAHGRFPFRIAGGSGEGEADGNDGDGGEGAGRIDDAKDETAGLKSALQKERDRAKTAERDLKKLQARVDELDGKDKSDVERLTKERDELALKLTEREQQVRERTGRVTVFEAARDAKAISTKAVYALIRDDLEFDDDGEPTNVESLITNAKKEEPSLFQAANGSGDGGKRDDGHTQVEPGMPRLAHAYANSPRRR